MDIKKLIATAAIVLMVYILAVSCTEAEDTVEAKKSNSSIIVEKKPSNSIVPFATNEISWRNDIEKALVIGGLIVCGVVLIGTFAWLISPVLGFKMCHLLGNCETEAIPYSMHGHGGNLQDLAQPSAFSSLYAAAPYDSYAGANYNNRKRSLDYLGPIIKTLASAYEKFEPKSVATPKTE